MLVEETTNEVESLEGDFYASLKRNNTKIREDRAAGISEDAELTYQRQIQDMEMQKKKIVRKRNNMLDLSPTNADSLMLGEDFRSAEFVQKDIQLGVDLRTLDIQLEIAKERFKKLFGKEVK